MMYHCIAIAVRFLALCSAPAALNPAALNVEPLENVLHRALHSQIHQPEKDAEEKHRKDDDAGGRAHVISRRPGDLPQFDANLVEKLARPVQPLTDLLKRPRG